MGCGLVAEGDSDFGAGADDFASEADSGVGLTTGVTGFEVVLPIGGVGSGLAGADVVDSGVVVSFSDSAFFDSSFLVNDFFSFVS